MSFTKNEIRIIISDILQCPAENIHDDTPLAELGYDSLKFIASVVEIESKYGIEVFDSDLVEDNFKCIDAICETLKKYFDNKPPKLFKCVITDCDGVLWHGVSGEDGDDHAHPDADTNGLCTLLHTLRKKGVLLAICSKNELANIEKMLAATPLCIDDFAIAEADISDKADSVSFILNEFGFSADNAVFIDDSAAELEFVKVKHPELTVIKADYTDSFADTIADMFAALPEADAIDRTAQFREQKEREKVHRKSSTPEEYNAVLETNITCVKADINDSARLSELSQRANRFNLTGARYSAEEAANMLKSDDCSIYKLCAADKFGDMGLVAMAVIRRNTIECFIMSCRVFGRGFENIMIDKIKSDYGENVIGLYHPTGKNDYCKDFYTSNGVSYELC